MHWISIQDLYKYKIYIKENRGKFKVANWLTLKNMIIILSHSQQ